MNKTAEEILNELHMYEMSLFAIVMASADNDGIINEQRLRKVERILCHLTVDDILADFATRGIVRIEDGKHIINDYQGLKEIACSLIQY